MTQSQEASLLQEWHALSIDVQKAVAHDYLEERSLTVSITNWIEHLEQVFRPQGIPPTKPVAT